MEAIDNKQIRLEDGGGGGRANDIECMLWYILLEFAIKNNNECN